MITCDIVITGYNVPNEICMQTKIAIATHRILHSGKHSQEVVLQLKSGAMLTMGGLTQQYWIHSVPREDRKCAERINLTFRKVRVDRSRDTSQNNQ